MFNGADGGGRNIEIGFAYFRTDAEKPRKYSLFFVFGLIG